ncbi:MAG TPA: hypothetical protein VLK33_21485 [Terriglobales bacterium]|nr:hypothetical protein [Terriglobales bacterium]
MSGYDSKRQNLLSNLEQELVTGAKRPKTELVAKIRTKDLVATLRQNIREGLESGPSRPWNPAVVKCEGRKKLANNPASGPGKQPS